MSGMIRQHLFLQCNGLSLYVLPGKDFAPVSQHVGILRALTYSQKQLGAGSWIDLDGRDPFYDHFLLIEDQTLHLAGTARLQLVQRTEEDSSPDLPRGFQSYLEHVYPGIKRFLSMHGHHIEIGRVAIAPNFQRQPTSLMTLFRGAIQLAVMMRECSLHGLVSYNHFSYSESVNLHFIEGLMRRPFAEWIPDLPKPRHPSTWPLTTDLTSRDESIQGLEARIRRELDDQFRLPILLRQYINLVKARVRSVSLAKDFNQITEIYMCADIKSMPEGRLSHFTGAQRSPASNPLNPFTSAPRS